MGQDQQPHLARPPAERGCLTDVGIAALELVKFAAGLVVGCFLGVSFWLAPLWLAPLWLGPAVVVAGAAALVVGLAWWREWLPLVGVFTAGSLTWAGCLLISQMAVQLGDL